jgi:hypothetical protein
MGIPKVVWYRWKMYLEKRNRPTFKPGPIALVPDGILTEFKFLKVDGK